MIVKKQVLGLIAGQGRLPFLIAEGKSISEAMKRGAAVEAITATCKGAQTTKH